MEHTNLELINEVKKRLKLVDNNINEMEINLKKIADNDNSMEENIKIVRENLNILQKSHGYISIVCGDMGILYNKMGESDIDNEICKTIVGLKYLVSDTGYRLFQMDNKTMEELKILK